MIKVHFCATKNQGFHAVGKQDIFLKILKEIDLALFDVQIFQHSSYDDLVKSSINIKEFNIFVLVYNEERIIDEEVNKIALHIKNSFPKSMVIHPPELGVIIGNKKLTNKLLSSNGVRTPDIFEDYAGEIVFSNTLLGSGSDVVTINQGSALSSERYNTKYIDTIFDFNSKKFYVSLRIMAFYDKYITTYIRCRDVSENNPSVHALNTPLDENLLNFLYAQIILKNEQELIELAKKLGRILGPGFYSHDVLFETQTKNFFVCETGFKFDEIALRNRLLPLKGKLMMDDLFYLESKKMAHYFLNFISTL